MLWPLHLNRYLCAALALAITLVYASITWFAFEKRLIFGSRGKSHAPMQGQTHAHVPATGGGAAAGTARQAPQSRA
jgi:hypothetical protein